MKGSPICGLFGMMGPGIQVKDIEMLKEIGIFSQTRGMDGCGIYQVKSTSYSSNAKWYDAQEKMYKSYETFSEALLSVGRKGTEPKFKELLSSISIDIVMGHVRWATRGDVTTGNAHPFVFDNIVGAHNGTLKDKKYEDEKKTDSEMMFADISQRGLYQVLMELDRDSAYAISMYDKNARQMVFARNELRTLSIAFLEDRGVMYWASELDMLKYVIETRNGEKAQYFRVTPGLIVTVKASDITAHNNRNNPLKALKTLELKDRILPTNVERANKAREEYIAKKKAEEEAEKLKEEKDKLKSSTSVPVVTPKGDGWTPSVVVSSGEILQFKPKDTDVKVPTCITNAHRQCKCGQFQLDPLQAHMARRGKHSSILYDADTESYHCNNCLNEEKKVVH